MRLAMIQDKVIPFDQVDKVYLDRGTFFGDGVYEVLRSYNGKLFELDGHLKRFERSLKEIGITGVDIEDIRKRVEGIFEKAEIENAKIYFHITRGSEVRNHVASKGLETNFFMTISEVPDASQQKENGIAVSTYPDIRWKRCDIKSLNLLANVMAKMDSDSKGCDEAILVNDEGEITEGSSSAFFAIIDAKLVTRPLGKDILPSITRKVILKLAEQVGLKIEQKTLTPEQAKNANELFIAVTTKDVVGIVKFDDCVIGNGKVGEFTKKLIEAFKEKVSV